MVYIDTRADQLDLEAALAAVSPQRRDYALRYRREHDRRLSLSAWLLLQCALRVEYGIAEVPLFEYGNHGKPALLGRPDIHFSLSHCREAAACVVDSVPVGIDVESLDSYDASLVPQTMNCEEQRLIASSPDPRLAFIRLWTMKESLLKMTGEGLTADMSNVLDACSGIDVKRCTFRTTVYPQFVCSVCCLNA